MVQEVHSFIVMFTQGRLQIIVYFGKLSESSFIILQLHVDDMFITGQDANLIDRSKKKRTK